MALPFVGDDHHIGHGHRSQHLGIGVGDPVALRVHRLPPSRFEGLEEPGIVGIDDEKTTGGGQPHVVGQNRGEDHHDLGSDHRFAKILRR
ncbi:unannotated protein [freshwater metagenome]|uniref:Unannotated protein n=1 Tax=freshwater metagenome TaxID=449393 RepID=A0A6J6ILM7_9ZZZZ